MSVSSLEGQNLTLNKLVVNNYAYSDVSGYVPSQNVFSSSVNSISTSLAGPLTCASITTIGGGTSVFNNSEVDFVKISVNGQVYSGAGILTGGTASSVFNDAQVNFNKISVNGEVFSGSGILTGAGASSVFNDAKVNFNSIGVVSSITLGGGILAVNGSGQLTFNGVVIS
jgi:hypothetical protein